MIGGRKWRPGRAEKSPEAYAETLKEYVEGDTGHDISLEYGKDEPKGFFKRYVEKTGNLLLLSDGEPPEKAGTGVGEPHMMRLLGRISDYDVSVDSDDGWELAGAYAWARGLTADEVEDVGDQLHQQYQDAFSDVYQEATSGDGPLDDAYEETDEETDTASETAAPDGGKTDTTGYVDAVMNDLRQTAGSTLDTVQDNRVFQYLQDTDGEDVQDTDEGLEYEVGEDYSAAEKAAFMEKWRQEAAPTLGNALHEIDQAAPVTIWDNLTSSHKYTEAGMEKEE